MYQVTPDEAKSRLLDLIEAALHGETVLIAKDEAHVVQLVPVSHAKRQRKAGSAKGTIQMSADFDAPLPEFEEYVARGYCLTRIHSSGLSLIIQA